nr:MAG TPA_asm: hypothetical protein [Caudoviricetes sp.]
MTLTFLIRFSPNRTILLVTLYLTHITILCVIR